MMKFDKTIFLRAVTTSFFFFLALSFAQAASYEVFMVRGDVIYEFTGEPLTVGATVASGERIKFMDKNSFAVLFGKGVRVTLSAKNLGDKFRPGQFVTIKKATKKGKSELKARPVATLSSKKMISTYFSSGPYLVLGEATIKISAKEFPLSKENYLYLRYNVAGEMMQATKVLRHHGNLVILDANDILQGGKKQINPDNLSNFELHYYGGVGKMTKVCPLELVLVDEQNLRLEIERLITIIRTTYGADGMDEETMRQEILNYLVEYYGTPDQVSFDDWADQTIN